MNTTSTKKFYQSTSFWLSIFMLLFSTAVNFFNSEIIQHFFPYRQPVLDTLFLLTPQIMWTQYLTDIAVLVSPIVLLIYIIKKDLEHLPYYIMVFSTGYLLRGFLILLNPIGGYFGNMNQYGLTDIMQHGMFPSGHTVLVFVSYYLSKGIVPKPARIVLLISCWVEVICLVLSRGHYGIDIIGGILVSYFVFNELKPFKKSLKI